MNIRVACIILVASWLSWKCTGKAENESGNANSITILATTGMIADVVKNIVGDSAKIITLMGPGVDPHLYKATQGDLKKLREADVIFYNGLHLEGKMSELFIKLQRQKDVIAVADGIEKTKLHLMDADAGIYDPHIWFDVSLWRDAANHINTSLCKLYPEQKKLFTENSKHYLNKMDSLHQQVIKIINEIPEKQRVLITAHDAFGYFGTAYQIEVRGLQGISTMSDYGLKDISDLVEFIIERNIKAIFMETSVSDRSINAVIEGCNERGHDVVIGGSLYSDAMGSKDTFEGTYIGMVSSNVEKIVNALK